MFWSFPVGRVAGTAVRIHITFLLFLAWLATDAYFKHGLAEASRTRASAVAIIDEDAKLRGLVTPETLSEMIMLYEASPSLFEGSSAASGSLEARNAIPQAVYVK